jgi:hypothetical protein
MLAFVATPLASVFVVTGHAEEAHLNFAPPLEPRAWSDTSVEELAAERSPVLLRGAVVDGWPARREWSWQRLTELYGADTPLSVVESASHRYMPFDAHAPLAPRLSDEEAAHNASHAERNVSASELFGRMRALEVALERQGGSYERSAAGRAAWRRGTPAAVHFAPVPPALASDLEPQARLYASEGDAEARMQYLWVSTPGARTHTHFDSDHNLFVQLLGTKRFVLWAPNQTARLCAFPRLHPLWHKSRADFEAPDLAACANYSASAAVSVDLGPGDSLYVPPLWWHTVETLTPSLSLSTLSRRATLRPNNR